MHCGLEVTLLSERLHSDVHTPLAKWLGAAAQPSQHVKFPSQPPSYSLRAVGGWQRSELPGEGVLAGGGGAAWKYRASLGGIREGLGDLGAESGPSLTTTLSVRCPLTCDVTMGSRWGAREGRRGPPRGGGPWGCSPGRELERTASPSTGWRPSQLRAGRHVSGLGRADSPFSVLARVNTC